MTENEINVEAGKLVDPMLFSIINVLISLMRVQGITTIEYRESVFATGLCRYTIADLETLAKMVDDLLFHKRHMAPLEQTTIVQSMQGGRMILVPDGHHYCKECSDRMASVAGSYIVFHKMYHVEDPK